MTVLAKIAQFSHGSSKHRPQLPNPADAHPSAHTLHSGPPCPSAHADCCRRQEDASAAERYGSTRAAAPSPAASDPASGRISDAAAGWPMLALSRARATASDAVALSNTPSGHSTPLNTARDADDDADDGDENRPSALRPGPSTGSGPRRPVLFPAGALCGRATSKNLSRCCELCWAADRTDAPSRPSRRPLPLPPPPPALPLSPLSCIAAPPPAASARRFTAAASSCDGSASHSAA
mmetsp:Transcript_10104/g.39356  ORF Transcript_10104/g.39356 Transcript_10104/m.39356 type:complete len:237 (+) Transcript_10104:581-1291(+)